MIATPVTIGRPPVTIGRPLADRTPDAIPLSCRLLRRPRFIGTLVAVLFTRHRRRVPALGLDDQDGRARDIEVRVAPSGHHVQVLPAHQASIQHRSVLGTSVHGYAARWLQLRQLVHHGALQKRGVLADEPDRYSRFVKILHHPWIGRERAHQVCVEGVASPSQPDIRSVVVEVRAGHQPIALDLPDLHRGVSKRARKVSQTIPRMTHRRCQPEHPVIDDVQASAVRVCHLRDQVVHHPAQFPDALGS